MSNERDITSTCRGTPSTGVDQLRETWARCVAASEATSLALARKLHDEAGQMIAVLDMDLKILQGHLPSGHDMASAKLAQARENLKNLCAAVREVMAELRPPVLDDYGIASAVAWHANRIAGEAAITVEVCDETGGTRCHVDDEIVLYRITEQALDNAVRHAEANRVGVTVFCGEGLCRITIEDDGKGFDTASLAESANDTAKGIGMMQERAAAIGGVCKVTSQPGKGTKVIVEIPLREIQTPLTVCSR